MIKLNKYHVTNGKVKARVWYSYSDASARLDGREAVTIYAKDYDRKLGEIFGEEYKNESDSMTDYFETGKVVLHNDHPLFEAAYKRATS